MDQRLAEMEAVVPVPNPDYNPNSKVWFETGIFPQIKGITVHRSESGTTIKSAPQTAVFELRLFKPNDHGASMGTRLSLRETPLQLVLKLRATGPISGNVHWVLSGPGRQKIERRKHPAFQQAFQIEQAGESTLIIHLPQGNETLEGFRFSYKDYRDTLTIERAEIVTETGAVLHTIPVQRAPVSGSVTD